jgi:hypothetical protein
MDESKKTKCSIPEDEIEYLKRLAMMDPEITFETDEVSSFAFKMFGYTGTILHGFNILKRIMEIELSEEELTLILNETSCDYNIEMYKIKTHQSVDEKRLAVQQAIHLDHIFKIVTEIGMFTTHRHGIVYRSFIQNVSSAKVVCGTPMNRVISTTLVKMYADEWGQCKDYKNRRNTKGFFSTIIIPAGTRSIIPSLVLPGLDDKKEQFELVLSPDGMFKDTGFVDSTGFKIFVYLDPHLCDMPMDEILMMEADGTNILGLIQCVFDSTYVGFTGGKTKRHKRRKTKYFRLVS